MVMTIGGKEYMFKKFVHGEDNIVVWAGEDLHE